MRKIILIATLMIASTVGVMGAEKTVLDRIDVVIDEPEVGGYGCHLSDVITTTQGVCVDDLLWGEGETFGVDYTGRFEENKTYSLNVRLTLSSAGYEITSNTKVFINNHEASIIISKEGGVDDDAFIHCNMIYDMTDPVVARPIPSLEMTLSSKLTVGMTIKDAIDVFKSNVQFTAGDMTMIKNVWMAKEDEVTEESSSLQETDAIQAGTDYYYVIQGYLVQGVKLNGAFCKNGNTSIDTYAFKADVEGNTTGNEELEMRNEESGIKSYDLMGRMVGYGYKGVVIRNGSVMLKK